MTPEEIAPLLVRLGCPQQGSLEMGRQLDRRAHQLAETKGRSYDEALTHLLRLMAGGWAAQAAGLATPPPPSPLVPESFVPGSAVRPWKTIATTPIADHRIFRIRSDRKINPRTGTEHDLYAIECVNWVNVVDVTRGGQLVVIDQFRHGTNTVEMEIPGGMMDADESDPVAAGLRELREETGYEGESARIIGSVFPNPAIQTNTCYTVLVENCERRHPVEFDDGEDLVARLIPVTEVPSLLASGRIRHALVVAALAHFLNQSMECGGKRSATPL